MLSLLSSLFDSIPIPFLDEERTWRIFFGSFALKPCVLAVPKKSFPFITTLRTKNQWRFHLYSPSGPFPLRPHQARRNDLPHTVRHVGDADVFLLFSSYPLFLRKCMKLARPLPPLYARREPAWNKDGELCIQFPEKSKSLVPRQRSQDVSKNVPFSIEAFCAQFFFFFPPWSRTKAFPDRSEVTPGFTRGRLNASPAGKRFLQLPPGVEGISPRSKAFLFFWWFAFLNI